VFNTELTRKEKLQYFVDKFKELEDIAAEISQSWWDDEVTEDLAQVELSMIFPCSADEWEYQIQEGISNLETYIKEME